MPKNSMSTEQHRFTHHRELCVELSISIQRLRKGKAAKGLILIGEKDVGKEALLEPLLQAALEEKGVAVFIKATKKNHSLLLLFLS